MPHWGHLSILWTFKHSLNETYNILLMNVQMSKHDSSTLLWMICWILQIIFNFDFKVFVRLFDKFTLLKLFINVQLRYKSALICNRMHLILWSFFYHNILKFQCLSITYIESLFNRNMWYIELLFSTWY